MSAINLWKLAGQATNYSPLPLGFTASNRVQIQPLIDLIVRFKAKSQSNARMNVTTGDGADVTKVFALSSSAITIEVSFTSKKQQFLYLYDLDSKGDIIITDIELSQKPLPQLTINGIDGFNSGKWTINGGSQVVDDETITMNPVTQFQANVIVVPVNPNTPYVVSLSQVDGNGAFIGIDYYNNTTFISNNNSPNNTTVWSFITPSSCNNVRVVLATRATSGFNTCTYKRPQINMGSIPVPYEKKKGDRMVMPVPQKNLLPSFKSGVWTLASGFVADSDNQISGNASSAVPYSNTVKVPVVAGKQYVISGQFDVSKSRLRVGTGSGNVLIQSTGFGLNYVSFTVPQGENSVYITCDNNNGAWFTGFLSFSNVILQEGTIPTLYQPYAVQVNAKPKRFVPKKNLFDKNSMAKKDGYYKDNTGVEQGGGVNASGYTRGYFPIKGDKACIVSGSSILGVYFYDSNKNWISRNTALTNGTGFVTPTNCAYFDIQYPVSTFNADLVQIEEGTTATAFESHQLILPQVKKGLVFNGTQSISYGAGILPIGINPITVEAWISGDYQKSIFGHGTYSQAKMFNLHINGSFQASIDNGGSGVTGGAVNRGGRNHVVGTYDGTTVSLYLNGALVGSYARALNLDDTMNFIGDGYVGKGTGTIHKFSAYNRCLSPSEISSNYTNGQNATNSLLVYDFENPSNIVGDKMIPNAKNLVPSFEDSRWIINSNSSMLGIDVLVSNSTPSYSTSYLVIPVTVGQKYLFGCISGTGTTEIWESGVWKSSTASMNIYTATTNQFEFRLHNGGASLSSKMWIRPILCELSGKEGTIIGKSQLSLESPQRVLTPKR